LCSKNCHQNPKGSKSISFQVILKNMAKKPKHNKCRPRKGHHMSRGHFKSKTKNTRVKRKLSRSPRESTKKKKKRLE